MPSSRLLPRVVHPFDPVYRKGSFSVSGHATSTHKFFERTSSEKVYAIKQENHPCTSYL